MQAIAAKRLRAYLRAVQTPGDPQYIRELRSVDAVYQKTLQDKPGSPVHVWMQLTGFLCSVPELRWVPEAILWHDKLPDLERRADLEHWKAILDSMLAPAAAEAKLPSELLEARKVLGPHHPRVRHREYVMLRH